MLNIKPVPKFYDWGSTTALRAFSEHMPEGRPLAELWYGAHAAGSSPLPAQPVAGQDLRALIASDPGRWLGRDVIDRFGRELPYLLKLIAPVKPLSLQVHPSAERARECYERENAAGIALDSPVRNYSDPNHKPELVYAISPFEALSGFRASRKVSEILRTLDTSLTDQLRRMLILVPRSRGVRKAFAHLLGADTRPNAAQIAQVAAACRARLEAGVSPSVRADSTVVRLFEAYGDDPGVVASLLLNPVTLQPGEAMFVPAGSVHAYLSGLAVEIMASSDNVLRAGLTSKHVDIPEMLECVNFTAAPPIRIAPEIVDSATRVFYAPVDDFELSVTSVFEREQPHVIPGRGPRVLLCLEGSPSVCTGGAPLELTPGGALFVSPSQPPVSVSGSGTLVQADVP